MKLGFEYADGDGRPKYQQISDREHALRAFDNYDWEGEVRKAHEIQKYGACLSVFLDEEDHWMFVSPMGETSLDSFLSECRFPQEITGPDWKRTKTEILQSDSFSSAQAREAISLFINESYDELRALYAQA